MAKQLILSDENCMGQVDAIMQALDRMGYIDLLEIELLTWDTAGLAKKIVTQVILRELP